jgi:hypothetical protein
MGSVEQAHGADVISVVMAVYGVSDRGRGHARDGAKEVVTYGVVRLALAPPTLWSCGR